MHQQENEMRWTKKQNTRPEWESWFAWHPVNVDGTTVWLEAIERNVQVICDTVFVSHRFQGDGAAEVPSVEVPPLGAPLKKNEELLTWEQVIDLFHRHHLPEPPFRLRDELVVALEWAWFGYASQVQP
jgi:hypothetical protein